MDQNQSIYPKGVPLKAVLDNIFKNNLPDTLFQTHYELSEKSKHTPNEWRQYLKDNEQFIISETAAIAEANARKALSKLGNGAHTTEVSAIKALLEKSKIINDAQKQQQHVLLTYLPTKGQIDDKKELRSLKENVQFLRDYQEYTVYLAENRRFDRKIHTEEWFKLYQERNKDE